MPVARTTSGNTASLLLTGCIALHLIVHAGCSPPADAPPADHPGAAPGSTAPPAASGDPVPAADRTSEPSQQEPANDDNGEPTKNKPTTANPSPPQPVDLTGTTNMNVKQEVFGKLPDGTEVDLYTISNANGLKVRVMTYGATIIGVDVPDRRGVVENVTLYLESFDEYLTGHPCLGSTVGRYANRIARAAFALDGTEYELAANNGPNHLHGGVNNFSKVLWQAEPVEADGAAGVRFSYTSPDGEEGYPGTLQASVTYSLTSDNELRMDYTANTDKPTIVNLTNHCYWNLGGATSGDVLDQQLMIQADRYLPVDDEAIPLGPMAEVAETPMDFRQPQAIGSRIDQVEGGYDHCYVLRDEKTAEPTRAARAIDPDSGRVMEVWTTEPGIQLYTANNMGGRHGAGGVTYGKHAGFCLEAQHLPDSPNRPDYPSPVLRPEQTYRQITVHKFSVE